MVRYFEDVEIGETTDCGSHTVTEEEILEFAEEFDPQPFHLDEEAAAESVFGGLVASGWHTAAICHSLIVEAADDRAFAGGRGVDELRWRKPVRPGTTISVETEIVAKDAEGGPEGVGNVDFELRGYDEDGDLLVSWTAKGMMELAEAATEGSDGN